MTNRAALYARYSSDRQNALSVADQLAALMRHAAAQGLEVVASFSDAAISGAAMANRPGLLAAIAAAERGEYDVLLTEDEDRIARNLEHLAHVANRLRVAGAHLATLSTAKVETMHVAFKGLIAEDYLRGLSQKTKRGIHANAERGLSTGGNVYGYRSQPGGETVIHEEEAAIIRFVFERYVAGDTARQIAATLNLRGVPGPRGGQWNASTINGSRQRANGLLRCELYVGVKLWNRLDVQKDPFTGRRVPKARPESEWKRSPAPALRIVDQETWDAVQGRKQAESHMHPSTLVRRKVGVFSGLLKCAVCKGSYTSHGRDRLVCATNRERGDVACANRRSLSREEVELRVLTGLQTRLLSPELMAIYIDAYRDQWRKNRATETDRRGPLERRLAEIARAESRTIDAIERGTATPQMEARMMEREAERLRLQAELDAMGAPEPNVEPHPAMINRFAEKVAELQAYLSQASELRDENPRDAELIASVRELVERIEIRPLLARANTPYDVTLFGRLSLFVKPATGETELPPPIYGRELVAGGGYSLAPIWREPIAVGM